MDTSIQAIEATHASIPGELIVSQTGQVLENKFDTEGLVQDLLDGFNNWIQKILPEQIKQRPLRNKDSSIIFTNLRYEAPTTTQNRIKVPLLPFTARNKKMTYAASLYVDAVLEKNGKIIERDTFFLGKIPIMLGCILCHLHGKSDQELLDMGECPTDAFGYFIINGTEKIVVIQEKLRINRIFIIMNTKGKEFCRMTCETIKNSSINQLSKSSIGGIRINLRYFCNDNTISVFQIFRLLASQDKTLDSIEKVISYILLFTKSSWRNQVKFALRPSILEYLNVVDDIEDITTKHGGASKLAYTDRKKIYIEEIKNELFPQISSDNLKDKLNLLAMMITRFAEYLAGLRGLDNRNSIGNKRFDQADRSCESLFRGLYNKSMDKVEKAIEELSKHQKFTELTLSSFNKIYRHSIITDEFVSAFNAKSWGVKGSYNKENITDNLKREGPLSMFSYITKINTPTNRRAKNPTIRSVQLDQCGYICPSESPEGSNCCTVHELVITPNFEQIEIGKLKDGDSVITINPITLQQEVSKIFNHFIKSSNEYGRKVVKVTTMNGRNITCTDDHPILTNNGWIESGKLNLKTDLIAVWPGVRPMLNEVKNVELILDETLFKNKLKELNVKDSLIEKHIEDLNEKGLLPLYNDHKNLYVLARICGFCLSDGSLGIYKNIPSSFFCFGTKYDGELFQQDVTLLGYSNYTPICRQRTTKVIDKKTKRESIHNTWKTQYSGSFPSLLLALDLIFGKRVEKYSKPLPEWILNGTDLVKREFIAGFQGGDGCKLSSFKCKNKKASSISIGNTMQHKCEKHVESLKIFMTQMRNIIDNFGIVVSEIKVKKDSEDRYKVSFDFSHTRTNILLYMDIVGYRYATTKSTKSYHISEYLKYTQEKINEKIIYKNKIIDMHKTLSISKISKILNVKKGFIYNIVKNINRKTVITIDTLRLEEWFKITSSNNNCVFIPVKSIEPQDDCMVADFTTESNNHSFVCNNITISNCGLVKHKAMTCYITHEVNDLPLKIRLQPYLAKLPNVKQRNTCMMNGKFLGWCDGPLVREMLISLRRSSGENKTLGLVIDKDEVLWINSDGGRATRPLLIVSDGVPIIESKNLWNAPFSTLLEEGAVEYIDAMEQDYILIAMSVKNLKDSNENILKLKKEKQNLSSQINNYKSVALNETSILGLLPETVVYDEFETSTASLSFDILKEMYKSQLDSFEESLTNIDEEIVREEKKIYTHCEIDPTVILGIASSIIPMANRIMGPRNSYQCLSTDTLINLSGKYKVIGELKDGDEVLTINPQTLKREKSKIKNYFQIQSDKEGKKIYEIKTYSGRTIKATQDHPFLTNEGWVNCEDLKINTQKVAIYPDVISYTNDIDFVILNEVEFITKLKETKLNKIKEYKIVEYVNLLKTLNLLPLNANSEKVVILSRMLGFLQADGHLGITKIGYPVTRWTFGRPSDAERFNIDMAFLGFKLNKICEQYDTYKSTGITHHTWNISICGAFSCMMIVLDGLIGRKTEKKSNPIPDWIMNGSLLIKREFVAGFMGGDGCKINTTRRKYKTKIGASCSMSRITQHKQKKHLESSIEWFEQLKQLFIDLNIETKKIKSSHSYDDKYKIEMSLSTDRDNLIKYMDNIGYRYATTKTSESLISVEWLKYVNITIKTRNNLVKEVYDLHINGMKHKEIAAKFNITIDKSQDLYKNYIHKMKNNLPQNSIRLEDWIKMVIVKEECIYEPIESIKEIEACLVVDFETESENHSFITGEGFCVSNCSMGKQALGQFHSNHALRFDTTAKLLAFPTRPMFETQMNKVIGLDKLPQGAMVVCAIMTYKGYGQEDAIILNKASVDLGLFKMVVYRSYKSLLKSNTDFYENFGYPKSTENKYRHLDETGVVKLGSVVFTGDVLMCKIRTYIAKKNIEYSNTLVGVGEEGVVDKIFISTSDKGNKIVKIKLRTVRNPVVGDKFASRYAQKSTISLILPQEDMPRTSKGIRPDIIVNPHAIPSRMTISKLIEIVASKEGALSAQTQNATTFGEGGIEVFVEELHKNGYQGYGKEVMYSGETGKQLEAQIFIGPCYYQALRHHVMDKIYMRGRGQVHPVTRQPVRGRSNGGALRFGEMERDGMVSHGATAVLNDRLCISSDVVKLPICIGCGLFVISDILHQDISCSLCTDKNFGYVEIPYSLKLLIDYLAGMNQKVAFYFKK